MEKKGGGGEGRRTVRLVRENAELAEVTTTKNITTEKGV